MDLLMAYPWIKAAHVALALTSGGLFAARGVGVLLGSAAPLAAPVRRLSQLIDTALLMAALLLLAALRLNPFATPWLQLKLGLLVAYIVLGTLALRRARTPTGRAMAFAAALACFAAMVAVARAHDPAVLLRLLPAG
ncbi:SirB2 family protein [Hydrogenophaga sp. YM1]|uniref:SirB2 family protein n=1 Tax=unclassified Hydrogenophaga TaxID=2610897 RepID=UPI0009670DBA|nr:MULTISPECIES: SirB2 family protein [unclassified Hydrogenophaga]MBN9372754.1 SirB2 family protein [Hydrogenophaga sp.]OJV35592.1 MAG: invasion activity up-regulator [Hydrogenophaga sp. 70-12]QRR34119.1 SirB2 family protein [Hydrogenophaga sp. YM1]